MDVQRFREVLKRRDETHEEYDYGLEMCWKEEVEILSEDIPSTIEYLKNQCTEDEFSWISEIIEDLANKTQSRELIDCYKSLMNKYPEETKKYSVDFFIECAEAFLEDSGEDSSSNNPRKKRG